MAHSDRAVNIVLSDGTPVDNSHPLPTSGGGGGSSINSGTFTDHSGTISSSNVSQVVMAANSSRKSFLFQNNSSETVWINFTTAAGFSQPSLKIEAGAGLELNANGLTTESFNVIGASSGLTYTMKELT